MIQAVPRAPLLRRQTTSIMTAYWILGDIRADGREPIWLFDSNKR